MSAIVPSSAILDEVVNRLVNGLDAESIYLFGSRAEGQVKPGSDYDLLVVLTKSEQPRHRREAYSYGLLWGMTVPVDLIVLTRAEFQRQLQVKTSLAARTRENGILLYGRTKGR